MLPCNTNVLLAAAAVLTASTAFGQVLVTEFMANPSGNDGEREWIEIYNAGDSTIDLGAYKIGTSETIGDGEDMNQFPAGTLMDPGQVFIIAIQSAPFLDWTGVQADFEIFDTDPSVPDMVPYPTWFGTGGNFAIANSADQILLLNGSDEIVDGVAHGTSFNGEFELPALGNNESYERVPANVDTNTAADWTLRGDGEATPGVVTIAPIPEPASLALLSIAGLGLLRRRNR